MDIGEVAVKDFLQDPALFVAKKLPERVFVRGECLFEQVDDIGHPTFAEALVQRGLQLQIGLIARRGADAAHEVVVAQVQVGERHGLFLEGDDRADQQAADGEFEPPGLFEGMIEALQVKTEHGRFLVVGLKQ